MVISSQRPHCFPEEFSHCLAFLFGEFRKATPGTGDDTHVFRVASSWWLLKPTQQLISTEQWLAVANLNSWTVCELGNCEQFGGAPTTCGTSVWCANVQRIATKSVDRYAKKQCCRVVPSPSPRKVTDIRSRTRNRKPHLLLPGTGPTSVRNRQH